MRRVAVISFLVLALIIIMLGPPLALAASDACYNIMRQDLRQQCLAEVSR